MTKNKSFIKQFWQEKKMVGSMVPSSKFLSEKMLKPVQFKHCKLIVELGPGNGVFTKKILEKLPADAKLLIFELNTQFYNLLKHEIQDERCTIIHGSAEHITEHIKAAGFLFADCILSSLPLANIPKNISEKIIKESYANLKNNGKYIQFQYSLMAKKMLETAFDDVQIAFTPLNFPPAFVYTCTKEKS